MLNEKNEKSTYQLVRLIAYISDSVRNLKKKQYKTKQNKTKQNKTKQNKIQYNTIQYKNTRLCDNDDIDETQIQYLHMYTCTL